MAVGVRPAGTRSAGDSQGEAMPRVAAAVDLTKAGFWVWFMPGVSSPGGGIGWTHSVAAVVPPTDTVGSDTAVGTESQSLVVALSSTDTGVVAEAESILRHYINSDSAVATEAEAVAILMRRESIAFATVFSNIVKDPETEQAAFATLMHNAVMDVPTPHIWHLSPPAGNRGDLITVVGAGFGENATIFEGYVTLGSGLPVIEDWRRIPPSPDALSSEREINSANDTADPEHDRIDFRIPENATSDDVRVYLNAAAIVIPPTVPPVEVFDGDSAVGVEAEVSSALLTSSDVGAGGEGQTQFEESPPAPTYFWIDDFERPDAAVLGGGWVDYGRGSIVSGTGRLTAGGQVYQDHSAHMPLGPGAPVYMETEWWPESSTADTRAGIGLRLGFSWRLIADARSLLNGTTTEVRILDPSTVRLTVTIGYRPTQASPMRIGMLYEHVTSTIVLSTLYVDGVSQGTYQQTNASNYDVVTYGNPLLIAHVGTPRHNYIFGHDEVVA